MACTSQGNISWGFRFLIKPHVKVTFFHLIILLRICIFHLLCYSLVLLSDSFSIPVAIFVSYKVFEDQRFFRTRNLRFSPAINLIGLFFIFQAQALNAACRTWQWSAISTRSVSIGIFKFGIAETRSTYPLCHRNYTRARARVQGDRVNR